MGDSVVLQKRSNDISAGHGEKVETSGGESCETTEVNL